MNISVAMATFNGEKYLREQLESIAAQSIRPVELVVTDDASFDNTWHILEGFRKKAPFPVRLYASNVNTGSTASFARSVAACSGELTALCDQDDIWYPDKLEQLSRLFRSPEVWYAFSDAELIGPQGNMTERTLWESVRFDRYRQQLYLHNPLIAIMKHRFVTGATMMFRADLKQHALPFPSGMVHDAWLATVATCLGYRGVAFGKSLIRYRCHDSQQIGAGNGIRRQSRSKRYSFALAKMDKQQRLQSYERQIAALRQLLERVTPHAKDRQQKRLISRLAEDRILELEILYDALDKRGAGKFVSLVNKNARKLLLDVMLLGS